MTILDRRQIWAMLFVGAFSVSFATTPEGFIRCHYPDRAQVGEEVVFQIFTHPMVRQVRVFAGSWFLGYAHARQGIATLKYRFKHSGHYKLNFSALNQNNIVLENVVGSIEIQNTEALPEIYLDFPPVPAEDSLDGRNSNIYLGAIGHPTKAEKEAFIVSMSKIIAPIAKANDLPEGALVAIACLESGYGFTRTAIFANNLFGIKCWGCGQDRAIQLTGQPDEDGGRVVVLRHESDDRKWFDESGRVDNWYYRFESRVACVDFFVKEILQYQNGVWPKDYRAVTRSYQMRLAEGWDEKKASKQFLYELAEHGYCHLGGEVYSKKVSKVME